MTDTMYCSCCGVTYDQCRLASDYDRRHAGERTGHICVFCVDVLGEGPPEGARKIESRCGSSYSWCWA